MHGATALANIMEYSASGNHDYFCGRNVVAHTICHQLARNICSNLLMISAAVAKTISSVICDDWYGCICPPFIMTRGMSSFPWFGALHMSNTTTNAFSHYTVHCAHDFGLRNLLVHIWKPPIHVRKPLFWLLRLKNTDLPDWRKLAIRWKRYQPKPFYRSIFLCAVLGTEIGMHNSNDDFR